MEDNNPARNAFIGHATRPSSLEIATALGPSVAPWTQFIDWLAYTHGVLVHEWRSESVHSGWTLRLKKKDRTIVYLAPCHGCFRVAFVFGSRAMDVVRQTKFPPAILQAIAEAPHYPEGTGIRLLVHQPSDLIPIRTLAEIKLAN